MATPYKLSDWNELIDTVNGVLQNPPDGCDPIDTIPHVDAPHLWAEIDDVQNMQNKIKETCPDIEFETIPELWKQDTIDEINEKLDEAWCECLFAPCEFSTVQGGYLDVFLMDAICDFNCTETQAFERMDWAPRVEGLQVATPGFRDRFWRVFKYRSSTGEKAFHFPTGTTGFIDCEGKTRSFSPRDTSGLHGMLFAGGSGVQLWARLWCGGVSGVPSECRDCDFDPVNCFPPDWPIDFIPGSTTIMVGCCFE
jgi:hypothetical protein